MERPTLEEQIRVSKMTRDELVECLMPHGMQERFSFWLHDYCLFLWRVIFWKWVNIWTGEKGFRVFAKHGFKEWGKPG